MPKLSRLEYDECVLNHIIHENKTVRDYVSSLLLTSSEEVQQEFARHRIKINKAIKGSKGYVCPRPIDFINTKMLTKPLRSKVQLKVVDKTPGPALVVLLSNPI